MTLEELKAIIEGATEGLLPCPFCGGQSSLVGRSAGRPRKAYCDVWGCKAYHIGIPVDAWNTRAHSTAIPNALALIEEMAEVLNAAPLMPVNETGVPYFIQSYCDWHEWSAEALTHYESFKADVLQLTKPGENITKTETTNMDDTGKAGG